MTTVVDASVLVAALVDSGKPGTWAEKVIGEAGGLVAPELMLIEAASALRGLERRGAISRLEATAAQRDSLRFGAELLPFVPFADRVWELRHNLSSYDALYVAIAETVGARLATLDLRLAEMARKTCQVLIPEP
jgi:predicted nucleic acid-binding protein